MEGSTKTRRELAMDFEDAATEALEGELDAGVVAVAQVNATLALCCRLADQTERIGDYLGDDSNLDRIAQALNDPGSGYALYEAIENLRLTVRRR